MSLRERVASAWQQRNVRVAVWVIMGIAVVSLVGYLAGRKRGKGDQTSYPKGSSIPDTWVADVAPGIISGLYVALEGWRMNPAPKINVFKQLLAVTDSQLIYISNEYNHQYYAGSTKTLLQLIEDEFVGFQLGDQDNIKIKQDVISRMRALDIR